MMKTIQHFAAAFTLMFVRTGPNTKAEDYLEREQQIRIEYGLTELQPLSDSAATSVRGTNGITPIQAQDFISTVLAFGPEQSLQTGSNDALVDTLLQLLNNLGPIASTQTPIGGTLNLGIDIDGRFRLNDFMNGYNNSVGTFR